LVKGCRRSSLIRDLLGFGIGLPLQVFARRLARQQADEGRDRSVEIGCAGRALLRLNRRSGVLRWCLIDLHPSVLCIGAQARCLSRP